MRIPPAITVPLLVLALVPGWSGDPRLPLYDGKPVVTVERIALDADDPSRVRVGRLRYLGGIHVRSADPAFGGYSAMTVDDGRFTLLSDGGLTWSFRLDDAMMPRQQRFGVLPAGPGTGWQKEDRDSESMAVDPATGRIWVGFERANAIWRYAPGFARAERFALPAAMRDWPDNGGAEAMARLRDGRFVVLAETARAKGGGTQALLFDGDPTLAATRAVRFAYRSPAGYRAVDAVQLSDRQLLVLHRKVSLREGFTSILSVVELSAIREGATVAGRAIARLAPPLVHDNFEGLAISREQGATIVWLVSDENGYEPFQRAMLLKFRLEQGRRDIQP